MKTIKKVRKVAWAIEQRKNCMVKDDSVYGYALFKTRVAAQNCINDAALAADPIKVLITIERPANYG